MRVLQAKKKLPLDLLVIGAGGHIAATSVEGTGHFLADREDVVSVWDLVSGRLKETLFDDDHSVLELEFLPGGERLFVNTINGVTIINAKSNTSRRGPKIHSWFPGWSPGCVFCVFSTTAKRVLGTANQFGNTMVVCQTLDSRLVSKELWRDGPHEHCDYRSQAISPDGTRVALWEQNTKTARWRNTLQIRDGDTGQILTTTPLAVKIGRLDQPLFTADNTKLLARPLDRKRSVSIFDAIKGKIVGELLHPGGSHVTGMAIHPNGTVACSRKNGTVCLWNLENRKLIRTLDWKLGKLVSVAFSPDGNIGAAGTADGQVIVWDVDE